VEFFVYMHVSILPILCPVYSKYHRLVYFVAIFIINTPPHQKHTYSYYYRYCVYSAEQCLRFSERFGIHVKLYKVIVHVKNCSPSCEISRKTHPTELQVVARTTVKNKKKKPYRKINDKSFTQSKHQHITIKPVT